MTNESLYDFLYLQQDLSKKELDIRISVSNDFTVYVSETLTNVVDNDFDLQTNVTSKFLFYNFNTLRKSERLPPIPVRHSKIIENETALKIIQSHNWQYFIETLIYISNDVLDINSFDLKDEEAFQDFKIIEKTQQNLKYCKQFYQEVFEDISYFLYRKLREIPDEFIEKIEEDLANEIYFTRKIKEIESHVDFLKIFSKFYFKTGRFPGNHNDLMLVPPGVKSCFVKSHDEISPVEINEKFHGSSSYGLASVQFIAALHSYFGSDKELSRNVMSEFFYNLSLQALTIDNDNIEINFDEIIELTRNLKSLIRDDDRNEIQTNDVFEFETFPEIKDKNQLIEEEVVSNITNNVRLEFPIDNENISIPNTAAEIQEQTNENNKIDKKLDAALNERDRETSAELVNEARAELIKSATGEGGEISLDIFNNVATTFDLQQENRQNKDVRKHVKETIKKDNEQFVEKKKSSVKLRVKSPMKTRSSTKKTN